MGEKLEDGEIAEVSVYDPVDFADLEEDGNSELVSSDELELEEISSIASSRPHTPTPSSAPSAAPHTQTNTRLRKLALECRRSHTHHFTRFQ